ncbi:YLP motif-containing protein 1-like [Panthera leo]|uniref:YLP motif-containing protein 1-like n=1 Tax=Panthera leo TaxID=9689 RepID=UPI001C6A0063|nr:YLP motif-containing protein 1-like [Panthera leo]
MAVLLWLRTASPCSGAGAVASGSVEKAGRRLSAGGCPGPPPYRSGPRAPQALATQVSPLSWLRKPDPFLHDASLPLGLNPAPLPPGGWLGGPVPCKRAGSRDPPGSSAAPASACLPTCSALPAGQVDPPGALSPDLTHPPLLRARNHRARDSLGLTCLAVCLAVWFSLLSPHLWLPGPSRCLVCPPPACFLPFCRVQILLSLRTPVLPQRVCSRSPVLTGQAPAGKPPPPDILGSFLPWGWVGQSHHGLTQTWVPPLAPVPLVVSPWVLATACPCEPWALPRPRPRDRFGGLPPGPVASPHTSSHHCSSPRATSFHRKPRRRSALSLARGPQPGWVGRRTRRKRQEKPPEERHPAPSLPSRCSPGVSCPALCLSAPSWLRSKAPSGILHGRDLDARPGTLRLSNPSAATGTPCTRSRGTGRTQRLWTGAAPCEEGRALPASPCLATRPLTDGHH